MSDIYGKVQQPNFAVFLLKPEDDIFSSGGTLMFQNCKADAKM